MAGQGLARGPQAYVGGGAGQDLAGVAVQAQQEADLVPGGVLRLRCGLRGEAVDQGRRVVGVAGGDQGQGGDGVGEPLLGGAGQGTQTGVGRGGGQRHFAGQ